MTYEELDISELRSLDEQLQKDYYYLSNHRAKIRMAKQLLSPRVKKVAEHLELQFSDLEQISTYWSYLDIEANEARMAFLNLRS